MRSCRVEDQLAGLAVEVAVVMAYYRNLGNCLELHHFAWQSRVDIVVALGNMHCAVKDGPCSLASEEVRLQDIPACPAKWRILGMIS